MQANNLSLTGRAAQAQAPAAANDLVRQVDVTTALQGYAVANHTHVPGDITGFSAGVLAVLTANGVALNGAVTIPLQPNGGLVSGSQGLAVVDSGLFSLKAHHHTSVADLENFDSWVMAVLDRNNIWDHPDLVESDCGLLFDGESGLRVNQDQVSYVGHAHTLADITDYAGAIGAQVAGALANSPSLLWSAAGSQLAATVQLTANGGLLPTAIGLRVDSGIVSLVGHTHAQLHNSLTLGSCATLTLALAGQQLSGEVRLAVNPGLLATGGLAVDFGTGHNQVMRGDALTSLSLTGVTSVTSTPTLALSITGAVLTGSVPLEVTPGSGHGTVSVGSVGLQVDLGTTAATAAAGNHTHSDATPTVSGLMPALDKTHLNALWSVLAPAGTVVPSVPVAGGTMTGVLTLNGVLTVTGATTTAPAGLTTPVAWFAASINGVNYKLPLYQ